MLSLILLLGLNLLDASEWIVELIMAVLAVADSFHMKQTTQNWSGRKGIRLFN